MPKVIIGVAIVILGLGAVAVTGCGDEGSEEIVEGCEEHAECLDDEACFGGECTDEPQEGDPCPEGYEGEVYEDLQCLDGSWQIDEEDPPMQSRGLQVVVEPSAEVMAGEHFEVEMMLVDEDDAPIEQEGVAIELVLNQGQFADGNDAASADTSSVGVAGFELVIEEANTGYELEATSGHEDFEEASANTKPFDVVAAAPDPELSSITGEDGVAANGEDEAEITIELVDPYGNPVVGVVPEFTASGQGNDYGECSATDAVGTATCSMTSTEVGDKTLEIVDPVQVTGETIAFVMTCFDEGEPFGGGDGTDGEPYLICSPDHLQAIGDGLQYLEDSFLVVRDIDLDGVDDFEPIGNSEDDPFDGSFDGQGFTIDNLSIDRPAEDQRGLFGHVGEDGMIVDIRLENVEISGGRGNGGLIGSNHGTVSDVAVTGSVSGEDSNNGGAVGWNAWTGVLTNVSADVDVFGQGTRPGGLVGSNSGEIIDSYATGMVTGGSGSAGGLVGRTVSSGHIMGSYATGDVFVENDGDEAGGLAGLVEGDVTDCHATGEVHGAEMVGGLVGYQFDGVITGSYATGDAYGTELVGGLVGYRNDGSVLDSYAMGDAVADDASVGGLVGYHRRGLIANAYATGEAAGDQAVGAVIGTNEEGDVEATYWDSTLIDLDEAVGDGDDEGVSGLETEEFDDASVFSNAGWDFTDVWTIGEAPDAEQRPILIWQQD